MRPYKAVDRTGFRLRRLSAVAPLALEPRFMFDAAGIATGAEAARDAAAEAEAAAVAPGEGVDAGEGGDADDAAIAAAAGAHNPPPSPKQVMIVDPTTADVETLLAGVDPDVEVIMLPADGGVAGVAAALDGRTGISSLHVVSHGGIGGLSLGGAMLTAETLAANAETLTTIAGSLAEGADVMLFGCKIGAGGEGQRFIDELAAALDADVAASDDDTGVGGDWDLEVATGAIETAPPFSEAARAAYAATLSAAPHLANLGGTVTTDGTYTTFLDIGQDAILSDADTTSFDGGYVFAFVQDGSIHYGHQIWAGGAVTMTANGDATEVSVDGVQIGAVGRTEPDTALWVELNANATTERVQTLVRNLTHSYGRDFSTRLSDLSVEIQVSDGTNVSERRVVDYTFTFVNTAPEIRNLDSTRTFTKGGDPVVIDPDLTAYDANMEGRGSYRLSEFTFQRAGGANADDVFGSTGTLSELVEGDLFQIDGRNAGWVRQNSSGTLVVQMGDQYLSSLNALVRQITYSNTSDTPPASIDLEVTYSDSADEYDGGLAKTDTGTIRILIDDPDGGGASGPVLGASAVNPDFLENGSAVGFFESATSSPSDPGDTLAGMTFSLGGLGDGAAETLAVDGTEVTLVDGTTLTTAASGIAVSVAVSGTTATVSLSGMTLSRPQTAALVEGFAYRNTSDDPTEGERTLVISGLVYDDNGTASLTLTSTVTVTAVNDPPVIGNLDGDSGGQIVAGNGPQAVAAFADVTVANLDSDHHAGGSFIISETTGVGNGTWGFDGVVATAGDDGVISADESIYVDGKRVGYTYAGGSTQHFGISLQFTASNAENIQKLIRALTYEAPSGLGTREFLVRLSDPDGRENGGDDNASARFSLDVTSRKPVISNLSGDTVSIAQGDTVAIDAGADVAISDADTGHFNGGDLTIVRTGALAGDFALDPGAALSGADGMLSVGETVTVGGVAVGTVTAAGQGTDSLVISFDTDDATPSRVATLTRALTYGSSDGGTHGFSMTVTDGGSGGATSEAATFTVEIDIAPENGVPDSFEAVEGTAFPVPGISVADADLGAAEMITVTVSVPNGIGAFAAGAPATIAGGGTHSLQVSGTLADVNQSLADLSFTPAMGTAGSQTITVVSSDGSYSDTDTIAVTVYDPAALNLSAPSVSANPLDPIFAEDGGAASLFDAVAVSANDTGQVLTDLTLNVSDLADGADEILTIDGTQLSLTDGNTATTAGSGLVVSASVSGATATVTLTNMALSDAQASALVAGLAYTNARDEPTLGARTVTIATLADDGLIDNSASPDIASTVNVVAANDAPVVENLFGDDGEEINAGAGAQALTTVADVAVGDIDSADLDGGTLTIAQTAGTANGHWGLDGTDAAAGGDATIGGGEAIVVGGVTVGTVDATDNGQAGGDLAIALSANATPARIQSLIRALTYDAPSGTGERTFTLSLADGDGVANGGADTASGSFTITVARQPPVVSGLDGDEVTVANGGAVSIDAGGDVAVGDADSGHFNGGALSVTRGGALSGDFALNAADATSDGDGMLAAGQTVAVGGVAIGTVTTAGQGGDALVVTFDSDDATPARVATLIGALTFSSTDGGRHDFTLTITDSDTDAQASAPASFSVTVDSVPVNTVPASLVAGEATALSISGISIADADLGSAETITITITISVPDGVGTFSAGIPGTRTGDGTHSLQIAGTLVDVNESLQSLTFTPAVGSAGAQTITVETTDGTYTDTDTIAVTVDARPTITGLDGDSIVYQDGGETLLDVDLDALLSDADTSNFDGGYLLARPHVSSPRLSEQVRPSGTVTIGGDGGAGESVFVDGVEIGTSFYVAHSHNFRVDFNANATTDRVQTLIRSLAYSNPGNTYSYDTQAFVSLSDGNSLSATATIDISVEPVNEAPVLAGVDATPTHVEGGAPVVLDADMSVSDPELIGNSLWEGASITVTRSGGANADDLFSASGTLGPLTEGGELTLNGTHYGTVTQNSGGTLVITFDTPGGTRDNDDVNAVLRQIAYANASDAPPATVPLVITVGDGNDGGQGSGGALSDSETITVSITGVDDAPVNTAPAATTVAGDVAYALDGLSVSDADSGALTTTISVPSGEATFVASGPATVTGYGTDSIVISGSTADVNATLESLMVEIPQSGVDDTTVTIATSDGTTTDTDTIALAVADAPTILNLGGVVTSIDGAPVTLDDGTAAVLSTDGLADLDGGYLLVEPSGMAQSDVARIRAGADLVIGGSAAGSSVTWQGVEIGTMHYAAANVALRIDLNGDATVERVEGVLRALTFDPNYTPSSAHEVTVDVTLSNGGAVSNTATVRVDMTASAGGGSFQAGGAGGLLSNLTISQAEIDTLSASGSGASMTLSRLAPSGTSGEFVLRDSGVSLRGGSLQSPLGDTLGFVSVDGGGSVTVTLNGRGWATQFTEVLRQVTYANGGGSSPTALAVSVNAMADADAFRTSHAGSAINGGGTTFLTAAQADTGLITGVDTTYTWLTLDGYQLWESAQWTPDELAFADPGPTDASDVAPEAVALAAVSLDQAADRAKPADAPEADGGAPGETEAEAPAPENLLALAPDFDVQLDREEAARGDAVARVAAALAAHVPPVG